MYQHLCKYMSGYPCQSNNNNIFLVPRQNLSGQNLLGTKNSRRNLAGQNLSGHNLTETQHIGSETNIGGEPVGRHNLTADKTYRQKKPIGRTKKSITLKQNNFTDGCNCLDIMQNCSSITTQRYPTYPKYCQHHPVYNVSSCTWII